MAIHSVDEWEGLPYIAMECIHGPSLQDLLDRGDPLEMSEVLSVGRQTAWDLAAAHATGLIHQAGEHLD